METHNFPEVAKVQRFCLTLTGEARLWYESLKHTVVDWPELQKQQSAFGEIKNRLQKPPVLHLLVGKERFHLYSDTSKYAVGRALYQIQNGKPNLIAYASKRLPEAEKNYSITELEMCRLAINITSFVHLLKKVDFDAMVDHLALVHML